MDPIEKAIRGALEKGNADDRAFREKVYRSAFAALDRALNGNPNIPAEVGAKRRSDLQAKIAEIETEFIPAVPAVESPGRPSAPPPVSPSPAPSVTTPRPAANAPAVELDDRRSAAAPQPGRPANGAAPPVAPPVAAPGGAAPRSRPASADPIPVDPVFDTPEELVPRSAGRIEPRLAGDLRPPRGPGRPVPEPFFPDTADFGPAGTRLAGPEEEPVPAAEVSAADGPNVATERRRPLAGIFLGVTLLALAGIGVWWGISTGLIKIPGPQDTDVVEQVPPPDEEFTPGEEEAPQKPGEADAQRNWIFVFSPSDPSTINAPGDAKAETMNDDAGNFVRIRSGASGSAIAFDVGKGVLEQISGKHAVFDIVARSEEGKETQFSVDCNFGELGDCGRKRYRAGYDKGEFLFEIELPAKAPGAEGTIAIASDVDNAGKALDVFEIKVSVSE